MATSVPPLWECLIASATSKQPAKLDSSEEEEKLTWHGYFLTYASTHVLKSYKHAPAAAKKLTPYKFKRLVEVKKSSLELAFILQHNCLDNWTFKTKEQQWVGVGPQTHPL
jgi:hypothetical protein